MNNFSEKYLRSLATDNVEGDFSPYNKNNLDKTKRYIKGILGQLSDRKSIIVEPDYNAYGSGFASYINVKIAKKNKSDCIVTKNGNKISVDKNALLMYISMVAPYWYIGGVKWSENYLNNEYQGGTMPFLMPENIKNYDKEMWQVDIDHITALLNDYQIRLLTQREAEKPLWFEIDIDTNMGSKPYTVFDCFFHWED
jgi:hypothetical protein